MKKSSKFIIQLIAVLALALVGQFIMDKCFRIPVRLTSYCVGTVLWLFAGCCYLVPRYLSSSIRNRIIGSFVLLGVFGAVRCIIAIKLSVPLATIAIIAPIPALATLCVLGALVSLSRKVTVVALVCLSTFIYFISLRFILYGFHGAHLWFVAVQLIPFIAVVAALLISEHILEGKTSKENSLSIVRGINIAFLTLVAYVLVFGVIMKILHVDVPDGITYVFDKFNYAELETDTAPSSPEK